MDPNRTVKYALDRVFALVLLVLSSPLLGLLAVAVRLDSPGSPFFLQERIGARGQPFTIFKFRTMRNGAERAGLGATTASDDERITRLGSFLRRTGLDELPQLLNILLGEMSFVGPRPTLRYQVDAYTPRQRRRLLFRPGITGWAQVHGRNDISWAERIELDLEYVRTHTLGLDLRILMRTLGVVLRGRGIYAAGGTNDDFLPADTDGSSPAHDTLPPAGAAAPLTSAGDDDFLATDSEGRVLRLAADGSLQPASVARRSSGRSAPAPRPPVTPAVPPPAASSSTPLPADRNEMQPAAWRADRNEMQSAPVGADSNEMQFTVGRAERGEMQSTSGRDERSEVQIGEGRGEESATLHTPASLPRWVEPARTPSPLALEPAARGAPGRAEPGLPLVVVGAGGHARVVIDAIEKERRFTIVGVLDDAASPGEEFLGYRILGGREVVEQPGTPRRAVVAIGAAAARGAWIAHLASLGYELPAISHPSAAVGRGVELGAGTVLLAGAVVNTGARLGRGVIVNTSASVDHDCVLADLVHVAPGARLAGNVRVGERAHIGLGACVIQGLEIGADVIVGAGAAVVNAIPAGTTVVGVPARPVRTPPTAPPTAPANLAAPSPPVTSQLPRS